MRICVLSDESIDDFDPTPFLAGYEWQMRTLTAPVEDKIQALVQTGDFEIFLNLCEGYEDDEIEPEDPVIGASRWSVLSSVAACPSLVRIPGATT